MKKIYLSLLLTALMAIPTLSYAVQPCGIICKVQTQPYFQQCQTHLDNCLVISAGTGTNDETARVACESNYQSCFELVKEFQLDCVDRCMNGDLL